MVFNTLQFAIFFAIVLLLYFRLDHKRQNLMLLVASYVFYGAWNWRFLSLIWITTVVDWWVGLNLDPQDPPDKRKRVLFLSLLFNLGFLAFFKYCGFFADSLHQLLATLGWNVPIGTLHIVLPVGISFYTFQSISYTVGVYRGQVKSCRNLLDFALFVAFFPQLEAGPIERAAALLPQVQTPRRVTREQLVEGARLILWGLYKKMVVADNMALIANPIFSHGAPYSAGEVIVGVIAFAFQIYGDFSGYTDIARGAASIMGFHLMVNFDLPYAATSPQEFWRRWHISLSTWLRDYLYVPLGGNRKGELRTYINLLLTMLLGGLWHGASWTFVAWGAYHGILLAIHRFVQRFRRARPGPEPAAGMTPGWWASWALQCVLTLYGWLLFRAQDFGQVAAMTRALVGGPAGWSRLHGLGSIAYYTIPLVIVQVLQFRAADLAVMRRWTLPWQVAFYLFCVYSIQIFGAFQGATFIYFQF